MKKNTTYSSHPSLASRIAHEKAKKQYPTYDTSLINPKKSKKKLVISCVALLVLCIITACAVLFFCSGCSKTLENGKTVEVTIDEGSSASQIADTMSKAGVVENAFVFKSTVSEMGADNSLKPGNYTFEGGKTVREYVQILCDGPESTSPKVVVAEGMTLEAIASQVENATKGKISKSNFIDAASDAAKYSAEYQFLVSAEHNSLEGFLFPKTYSISSKQSTQDIIKMMLDQFDKEFKTLDTSYPSSLDFTIYDIINLASIVEKESNAETRYKIASVFYNRLKFGMHLDSDATTSYVVGREPTSAEIHSDDEYSTYTNYGLPPTPICSPGLECLKAVCAPDDTNYLYFAFADDSQGKRQCRFSETFEDHQQALIDLGIV